MSKQVPWNKLIVEEFAKEAMLSNEEQMILRTRVMGWTRIQQSQELGLSVASVDRIISGLKEKYDAVQKYDPLLPPRRTSKEEEYMDTH